jgi:uncharacterized protein YgiM (DUF1202 family)
VSITIQLYDNKSLGVSYSVENKNIQVEDQLLLPKDYLNMDTNTLNKDEIIKTFYRKEICKQEACGIR